MAASLRRRLPPTKRPSANAVVKLYGRPSVFVLRGLIVLGIAYAAAVYVTIVLLAALPSMQALLVCMHWVKWFVRADYAHPSSLYLLNARNVRLNSTDGVELGAWHALPARRFATQHLLAARLSSDDVDDLFDAELASSEDPVVLFFHGNAETRATSQGPVHLRAVSSFLSAHAVALDYRGFGDSRGWPSEAGMLRDARATWDWATRHHGVAPSRVVLWGHSLGAGVAAALAAELAELGAGQQPMGLVLESPFRSLPDLLPEYPLGRAVCWIPGARILARAALAFRFDVAAAVAGLDGPILILHGGRDRVVPVAHAESVYAAAGGAGDGGGGSGGGRGQVELVVLPTAGHDDVLAHPRAVHSVARMLQRGLVESPMGGAGSWAARLSSLLHADAGDAAASRKDLVDAWAPVLGGAAPVYTAAGSDETDDKAKS